MPTVVAGDVTGPEAEAWKVSPLLIGERWKEPGKENHVMGWDAWQVRSPRLALSLSLTRAPLSASREKIHLTSSSPLV